MIDPRSGARLEVGGALLRTGISISKDPRTNCSQICFETASIATSSTSRQMGKTSLVARIVLQFKFEGVACSFFDIGAILDDAEKRNDWYKGLAAQIADNLGLHRRRTMEERTGIGRYQPAVAQVFQGGGCRKDRRTGGDISR